MSDLKSLPADHPPRPLPEENDLPNMFSGWGIWVDPGGSPREGSSVHRHPRLGLLLFESEVNLRRFFLSGAVFGVLALLAGGLALGVEEGREFFLILGLIFLALALYRVLAWFLNRGTRVSVYREGLTVTTPGGEQTVRWDEIREAWEDWRKVIYQGIIHIHSHQLKMILMDGRKVVLDRTIKEIPRISQLVQQAAAQHQLPEAVESLREDRALAFGPVKISRYGIQSRAGLKTKTLPWDEVSRLTVDKVGQTTLKFYKKTDRKFVLPWSSVPGKKVPNQYLLILLAEWLIRGRVPEGSPADIPPQQAEPAAAVPPGPDVRYLLITEQEAREGTVKTLVVGSSQREREITLRIPPGTQTGKVFRFPGAGDPGDGAGRGGELQISLIVEEKTPLRKKIRDGLLILGVLLLILGMMWISLWSYLPLLISTAIAAAIGGVSGALMAYPHRIIGAASGFIGGGVSFGLQIAYYRFMYLYLGRFEIWNYEAALLMFVSLIPGGLLYYFWMTRRGAGEQLTSPSVPAG